MGVMMGLIGFSLSGGGSNEIGVAQRELLGMIHKARTQAALTGQETRLLVSNEAEDKEKYHRKIWSCAIIKTRNGIRNIFRKDTNLQTT